MIPAGFTATTDSFKFTYGSYDGTAKVEEVDGKGPNGEQLLKLHYLVLHQTLRLLKLRAL